MKKCKGCQWYNKPYWSIINPCDNCPREETNIEIITRWQDPIIEEQQKEIERLNNIINEALRIAKKLQYDIHDESCSHGTKKIDNLVNLLELKGSDKE